MFCRGALEWFYALLISLAVPGGAGAWCLMNEGLVLVHSALGSFVLVPKALWTWSLVLVPGALGMWCLVLVMVP